MKRFLGFLLIILSLLGLASCDSEVEPIDEIESYTITVNPLNDGTLNMSYNIKWKVLDSDSEGPLEWVKIGVANKYVSNIRGITSASKSVEYYSDDGAYIRVDLDRSYFEGETVEIGFSFIQSRIFTSDDNHIYYQFIPGWFDEIMVKQITVKWNSLNVIDSNSEGTEDSYLVWNHSLNMGESISCELTYDHSAFPSINLDQSYSDDTGDTAWIFFVILGFVVLFVILILVVVHFNSDDYYSYRGFRGTSYYFRHHYFWLHTGYHRNGKRTEAPKIVNTGGSHSGGHGGSCACACACACAGGGRAGCSRKDFYHPKLEIDALSKALKKNK